MDELEILKKDWKKREHSFNQLTEHEIYKMLHKKSSSIVKWILIISICEFFFWISISLILKNNEGITRFYNYDKFHVMLILEIINYFILIYFIIKFFKNYIKINTIQPIGNLIENIINTQKTVRNYIKTIIIYTIVVTFIMFFIQFNFDPEILKIYNKLKSDGNQKIIILLSFITIFVFVGLLSLLIWLFYKLLYGILLKNLYRNYKELKKINY